MLAVGIDLGTTYSCVGVWRNDRFEIIPNEQGNPLTPSYVSFSDEMRLVGEEAKYQARIDPKNTVFNVKRLIGRKIDDHDVQADMKLFPFAVFDKNGRIQIGVEQQGRTKELSPEEISAMLLLKMKENAESYLAAPVTAAVITVPASFNDLQRRATEDAATIAGLKAIRIINESTAAAVAYGLDTGCHEERNILIYDLGGGTLNVLLLTLEENIFEVKATAGHPHLGGEDFDNRVVNYLAEEFKRKNKKDLSRDPRALRRLRNACERAKRALSSTTETTMEIHSLFDRIDFSTVITRALFEELCGDLFQQALDPVERVLRDSKIDKGNIHEIVLVGGSTRIPRIVKLVSDFFNGMAPRNSMNPDEAVVYGAAVQASILSGDTSERTKDLILLDVISNSLGIESEGGQMLRFIKRNTTIPTKKPENISTHANNQTDIQIHIYEGERACVKDNNFLGTLKLSGLPPAPRGVPQVVVTFDLDANGTIMVSARDITTGRSNTITITNDHGRLSREELDRMIIDAERYKEDRAAARIAAKNRLRSYAEHLRDLIQKISAEELDSSKTLKVECAVNDTLQWLNEEYEEKLKELKGIANLYLKDDALGLGLGSEM